MIAGGVVTGVVLVYLREGDTFEQLRAGFGVSITTAWRYVNEAAALLSARSPKLHQALRQAIRGRPVVPGAMPQPAPRGPGERANAQLKAWRILAELCCCPHRASHLANAIHVLQIREVKAR